MLFYYLARHTVGDLAKEFFEEYPDYWLIVHIRVGKLNGSSHPVPLFLRQRDNGNDRFGFNPNKGESVLIESSDRSSVDVNFKSTTVSID